MTLVACRECLNPVNYNAHTCPHCGAQQPNGSALGKTTFIVLLAGALILAGAYFGKEYFPHTVPAAASLPAGKYVLAGGNEGPEKKQSIYLNGLTIINKVGLQFTVTINSDTLVLPGFANNGKTFKVQHQTGNRFWLYIPGKEQGIRKVPFVVTTENQLQFIDGSDSLVYKKTGDK